MCKFCEKPKSIYLAGVNLKRVESFYCHCKVGQKLQMQMDLLKTISPALSVTSMLSKKQLTNKERLQLRPLEIDY